MSDFDDESVHSGTSVPSIGEDYQDPQVQHLIVGEECCRAIYRSIDGVHYICPRNLSNCHKRNHLRLRVTALGEPGIYEIHRGTRGGFKGVNAHRRLSPADHNILLEEARERNRANAAMAAGLVALGGTVPLSTVVDAPDPAVVITTTPPIASPTPAELMATIAQLQALLAASMVGTTPPPAVTTPPAIIHVASVAPLLEVPPTIPGPVAPPIPPVTPAPVAAVPITPAPAPTVSTVVPAPIQAIPVTGILRNPLPTGGTVPGTAPTTNTSPALPSVSVSLPAPPATPTHIPTVVVPTPVTTPPATPPTPGMSTRWYVVVIGWSPTDQGVYGDWADVAPQVNGVSGAIFQHKS
jgi:hypothetical protein